METWPIYTEKSMSDPFTLKINILCPFYINFYRNCVWAMFNIHYNQTIINLDIAIFDLTWYSWDHRLSTPFLQQNQILFGWDFENLNIPGLRAGNLTRLVRPLTTFENHTFDSLDTVISLVFYGHPTLYFTVFINNDIFVFTVIIPQNFEAVKSFNSLEYQ